MQHIATFWTEWQLHQQNCKQYKEIELALNIYFSKGDILQNIPPKNDPETHSHMVGMCHGIQNLDYIQVVIQYRITPQLQSTFLCFVQRMWLKLRCISY